MVNRIKKDTIFKRELAEIHSARDQFTEAARAMESINLEQTNREVSYADKADVWLTTAEYWFSADDSVNAEKFINKAAHIMHHCL